MTASAAQDAHILFQVGANTYALPSSVVERLEMLENVTPVPNAPPEVEGIVASRGEMIPVVSLRARLGLPAEAAGLKTRLIVVRWRGRVVGLVADSAREFVRLAKDAALPPPEALGGAARTLVEGVAPSADRLIMLLSLDTLLGAMPGGDSHEKIK